MILLALISFCFQGLRFHTFGLRLLPPHHYPGKTCFGPGFAASDAGWLTAFFTATLAAAGAPASTLIGRLNTYPYFSSSQFSLSPGRYIFLRTGRYTDTPDIIPFSSPKIKGELYAVQTAGGQLEAKGREHAGEARHRLRARIIMERGRGQTIKHVTVQPHGNVTARAAAPNGKKQGFHNMKPGCPTKFDCDFIKVQGAHYKAGRHKPHKYRKLPF